MGLTDLLLPERLPGQIIYAGDRHCEIFTLANGKVARRERLEAALPAEAEGSGWQEIADRLQPLDTGIVLNSDPFIFNCFEFDKLPWSRKLLGELVDWKLQKIFPEDIGAYDHRFFRLNKRRILSVLVKKALLEHIEALFREKRVPLIFIGSSTLEILNRQARLRRPPDFFVEMDDSSCCLVFQNQGLPIYMRKFNSGPAADMAAEISRTAQFVKNNYGGDPRRYEFIDHRQTASAEGIAAELAGENLSRQNAPWAGKTPHIPGSQ
jgi:hypothetical protein